MVTLVGISGSLRRHSFNTALLREATQLMPSGSVLKFVSIEDIPLYNGDIETNGIPASVEKLKAQIRDADGLLLASPEYNNTLPGVLKNTIDWASRPPADSAGVFRNKAVACIGATPGNYGTILAQDAWLSVFRTLAMRPWCGGRLMVSKADKAFDDNDRLINAPIRAELSEFLQGFVRFVESG
jgi:NAD(P)H-dependent FMN reductase